MKTLILNKDKFIVQKKKKKKEEDFLSYFKVRFVIYYA